MDQGTNATFLQQDGYSDRVIVASFVVLFRPQGRPPIINDSGYSSVVPVSSKDYSIIFNRNNEKQATSNNS